MRRSKTVIIPGERSDVLGHRDNGKVFIVTEMSADQAERWAARLLVALMNAGAELPDEVRGAGLAGLVALGFRQAIGQLPWDVLEPLYDEMMTCVQWKPSDKLMPQPLMSGALCQTEEVATRVRLRAEVIELHTGFSMAGLSSTSAQAV